MDPKEYGQLIFNKDVKVIQWIGDTLKQMILEQLELIAKKKKKKEITPYTKIITQYGS